MVARSEQEQHSRHRFYKEEILSEVNLVGVLSDVAPAREGSCWWQLRDGIEECQLDSWLGQFEGRRVRILIQDLAYSEEDTQ